MLRILLQPSAQHDSASRRVLSGDERDIAANLRTIAAERHLKVRIAYDGNEGGVVRTPIPVGL